MNVFHYTDAYILNPTHPITVNVIGCGGTGSHVITGLVRMHLSLRALGKPGLYVTAFDSDRVSPANIGRQGFSDSDIGQNKAICMITRANRFSGTNWRAIPCNFSQELIRNSGNYEADHANFTISCVDSISSRKAVKRSFQHRKKNEHPYHKPIYWMDFGNNKNSGQVLLSTIENIKQPKDGIKKLDDIFSTFKGFASQKEDRNEPSCSMIEALEKQDLFINPGLAQFGLSLVWSMLRAYRISNRGAFMNLETLKTNPIPIE